MRLAEAPAMIQGKPTLWYLEILKSANEGFSTAKFDGDWGPQRRRIHLDLGVDYRLLWDRGLEGMVDAMRQQPGTDFFLEGGPFDGFKGYELPGNFWAGAVVNAAKVQTRSNFVDDFAAARLVLQAVDARKWLLFRGVSGYSPITLCEEIGPRWVAFAAPKSVVEMEAVLTCCQWLHRTGRRFWIDASHKDLAKLAGPVALQGVNCHQLPL